MSVFLTLLELNFSGVKRILYFPEYKKLFLSGFFCSKRNMRKRSIFWQKPWTNPFAKCRFFYCFLRTIFLWSKKHFFLSRISKNVSFLLFCFKKKMKKRSIFWQKPWTNPFANCQFFLSLWELHFWGPKSFIFYPEYQKMFSLAFFG